MFLFTNKILVTCLLLLCCHLGYARLARQTLQGIYVANALSKVPVPDAFAQCEEAGFFATADERGFISFKNLPLAGKKLYISCIGFEPKTVDLATLAVSDYSATVYLDAKIASLEEVRVNTTFNGHLKTISDLDIHLRPIHQSQEVLRMVPGLFTGQHAGGGKAEQIFLRGFDIDHGTDIQLTVDGMPVNMVSHAHGQGYADLHFVIPELIQKVNFNKGPYFADKGNFTTAGFVEFKTRDYLDKNFVKVEGGQFNTFRGVTGINLIAPKGGGNPQSLYFGGEASFTQGYFKSPQDFSRFNAVLKYHGSISSRITLTAAVTGFRSGWNASGQIPNRAVEDGTIGYFGAIDDTEGGQTERYNVNIELLSRLNNGGLFRNQLFFSRYKFDLYSNFTFFKEDPVNGDQIRQKEKRNLAGYNSLYEKEFFIGKLRGETKAGLQVRFDAVNNVELSRTKNRQLIMKRLMWGDVHEFNSGLHWSSRLALTKKLHITGGLRGDFFTNSYTDQLRGENRSSAAAILSPKLHLTYGVSNKVQLYLYNGRGFHSNDTRVAVQQNGRKVLPPAYGTDLGGIFKWGKRGVLQTALWYLWLDQEFIYVGDEGVVEAGGQTKRYGMDLSVRYEALRNLFVDADVSLARARALHVAKSESYLPLAPRFTSVGGLTYRKEEGFGGSLRYRFMDNRPANSDNSTIAKGYFVADAALMYTAKKWEGGLSIQNLLNTKWKETQFETESRLQHETEPVTEIHFTPGTPFFVRASFTLFF